MNLKYLHTAEGQTIPVRVATWEGKTFLECQEPEAFLNHIAAGRSAPRLTPDMLLRGVVIRGQGAIFHLRDQLGTIVDEIARMNDNEVQTLLLNHLW